MIASIVPVGATPISAYPLATVALIVVGAIAILSALLWLMPRPSAFATFWDQIENPLPPPAPIKISWITLVILVVAAACLVIGIYIIAIFQNTIPPCPPQNMSQTCQALRQIINNSMGAF